MKSFASFILTIPLLLFFLAWAFQEQLIYPGLFRTRFALPEPFRNVEKTGCYFKPGVGSNQLWIVMGGNGSLPQDYQALATKTPHSYLLINYPGFGGAPGKMKPATTVELINDCLNKIKILKPGGKLVVNFMCYSIGCAVGLHYLAHNPKVWPKRLVLLAPFWKLEEVVANKYTYVVPEWIITSLINHTWDNFEHIEEIAEKGKNTEVIIVHGRNDALIDWTQGQRLAEKHGNARFVLTDDDHNSIVERTIEYV